MVFYVILAQKATEVSRQITEIIELPIESEMPINDRLSSPFVIFK